MALPVKAPGQADLDFMNEEARLILRFLEESSEKQKSFVAGIKMGAEVVWHEQVQHDARLKEALEHMLEENQKIMQIQEKLFSRMRELY